MDVQYIRLKNAKLTEGRIYPFRILKTVSLGPDDDWLVLQDPAGYKILLPKKHYEGYGLEQKKQINCRVDKINCNGQIFLEPEHPVYKEGEVYPFQFICKGHRKDLLNRDEYYFMVRDELDKDWKVRTFSQRLWDDPPEKINCAVKRIKKGKLFLVIAGEIVSHPGLEIGQSYNFRIVDERVSEQKEQYFILQDAQGALHLLNKKYFLAYGLKKGDVVKCHVDNMATEGYFMLEPEHPCYVWGKHYEFPVDRLEERIFTDGYKQRMLVVKDCFGEEVSLGIDQRLESLLANKTFIRAKVNRIRKSRLELSLADEQPI